MAIFIKDENYKELSKIFLKDIEDYKQICKVYICTGPNEYELLFDGCADIFCDGTEDGLCSDCRIRWLSIYDDLLIGTDGVTEEGLSKIICPVETCQTTGLDLSCMDDQFCCDCEEGEICTPLFDQNCSCLQLNCTTQQSFITNTCQAYAWLALGGTLDGCQGCIVPERTEFGTCCKFGRKYTYIKKVIWNNDPKLESNCAIKKTCPYYFGDTSEGGVAKEGPSILECNTNECPCFPYCCSKCNTSCEVSDTCARMCNPDNQCFRSELYYLAIYGVGFDEYKCIVCGGVEDDPCDCRPDPPPEGCDVCAIDPCDPGCWYDQDCNGKGNICDIVCGQPPDIYCAIRIAGLPGYLDILEECGCGPPPDACDIVCGE
jgi:hypothetical protein